MKKALTTALSSALIATAAGFGAAEARADTARIDAAAITPGRAPSPRRSVGERHARREGDFA